MNRLHKKLTPMLYTSLANIWLYPEGAAERVVSNIASRLMYYPS